MDKKSETVILDNLIEGIQIISPAWRYLYVNDAAASQNRESKDNILGKTITQIYPDFEQTQLFTLFKKCMNERVPVSIENEFTFPDGHNTWFEARIEPVPEGIFVLSIDITDRKKEEKQLNNLLDIEKQLAEKLLFSNEELMFSSDKLERQKDHLLQLNLALNNSEEKFLKAFHNNPAAMNISDEKGRWINVNESFSKLTGYNRNELIGHTSSELNIISTKKHDKFYAKSQIGQLKDVEVEIKTKSGAKRCVLVSSELIKIGHKTRTISFIYDITQNKQRENAQKKRETKFKALFENSMDAVILGTPDGDILNANTVSEKMLGYTEEELRKIGRNGIIDSEDPNLSVILNERLHKGKAQGEINFIRKDGTKFPTEMSASIFEDIDGNKLSNMVIRDITQRKEIEHKLKENVKELARSNQELEHFAHVASHDLREPLRMITSFLQLLEKRYKDQLDEDANEFIGFAVDGAKRLDIMIKDLLEYSQVMKKEREFNPVKLDKVLEETLINLVVQTEDNNAIITYDPLPTIIGDEKLLVYLFQNLIGNAIKYRSSETPKIHISATKQKDRYLFSVKDNGIGMESEHLNRIFTIFQRLHGNEEYEGTGIGLAIVQKIVYKHGGNIWVESELGKGSTFYFTIPNK